MSAVFNSPVELITHVNTIRGISGRSKKGEWVRLSNIAIKMPWEQDS
jgi:hypothetical protein